VNLAAGRGVAVREFIMKPPHGRADYLLFVDGSAVGVLEAKPAGTALVNVEPQRDDYAEGVPDDIEIPIEPIPFLYISTGKETRYNNGLDPDARTRNVVAVHRPETLAEWVSEVYTSPLEPTLRHRLRKLPPLDTGDLWPAQIEATVVRTQPRGSSFTPPAPPTAQARVRRAPRVDRRENARYCRIFVRHAGTIDDAQAVLDEIRAWGVERLLRIRRVFAPRARALTLPSPASSVDGAST